MNTPVPPFDAVKLLAGRLLEQALNRLLALDEASRDKLRRLEGRRIEAHMQSPDVALAVDVCEGHLRIGPVTPGVEADVSVKSRLSGLLHALPLLVQGKTAVGAMHISGDVELARVLQDLVKGFDPDWQAPFVTAFGPVLGPQVAKILREGLRHARVSAANLARSGADYATEEARVVVGRAELEAFHTDVDRLRQRGDRLQARVDRLLDRLR